MNRLFAMVATMGATVLAGQVHAIDSNNPPTMSRREMVAQIAACMKKRISANKDSSYRDAFKACRNQLKKDSEAAESGALVASDPEAKH
jgi:hypothetical protein